MPAPEAVLSVVREWIGKADNDLANASHSLRMGYGCPTDTVCFHAQQCVEKCLKALLVHQETVVPKTHNVRLLLSLLPASLSPDIDATWQERLTEYATVTRYPGDYEPISLAEARDAVRIARHVRTALQEVLPGAAFPARATKARRRK